MRTSLLLAQSLALIAFAATLADSAQAEETLWQTDFAAAQAQAKAEHKFLLVDFTGSDWCPWCVRLKEEVFDKTEFQTPASKQFVFVELDFPSKKKLPEELERQNDRLGDQYGYRLHGFPTVMLLDANGDVITRTGYRKGGPEPYLKHLSELLELHASLSRMRDELPSAKGGERATLLDRLAEAYCRLHNENPWETMVFEHFPAPDAEIRVLKNKLRDIRLTASVMRRFQLDSAAESKARAELCAWLEITQARIERERDELNAWTTEIPALDAENKAGLKLKYELHNLIVKGGRLRASDDGLFDDLFGDSQRRHIFAQAVALPDLTGEQRQWAYYQQSGWYSHHLDYLAAIACLKKALAAAPESASAGEVKELIESLKHEREEAQEQIAEAKQELKKTTDIHARLKLLTRLIWGAWPIQDLVPDEEMNVWYREIATVDVNNETHLKSFSELHLTRVGGMHLDRLWRDDKFDELEAKCDNLLPEPGVTQREVALLCVLKAMCCWERNDYRDCLDHIQRSIDATPKDETTADLLRARQRVEKKLKEESSAAKANR